MAKKNNKVNQKKVDNELLDNMLPQNILPIGERVEEDKNIYISQNVYKDIQHFTKDKTEVESGGVLLGNVICEFGKTNIIIRAFIEAKYCEGTPTTLKFTHESWDYIHKQADKLYPKYKILGWIHTHPNFGIFLSEYDKFIQNNFFNDENQIAYVIDPIQKIEGFYFWINSKIEKCKGFYIFDNVGRSITIENQETEPEESSKQIVSNPMINYIVAGILGLFVITLLFVSINQSSKIRELQQQQETLASSANQALSQMAAKINSLSEEIEEIQKAINEKAEETSQDDQVDSKQEESNESTTEETDKTVDSTSAPEESKTLETEETDSVETMSESVAGESND